MGDGPAGMGGQARARRRRGHRAERLLTIAAPLWAAAMSLFFMFGPVYAGVTDTVTVAGPGLPAVRGATARFRSSGLAVNGRDIVVPLSIPVVLALAPLVTPARARRRVTPIAGALLAVFCFVASMSVGVLYVPAAVALLLAVGASDRPRDG